MKQRAFRGTVAQASCLHTAAQLLLLMCAVLAIDSPVVADTYVVDFDGLPADYRLSGRDYAGLDWELGNNDGAWYVAGPPNNPHSGTKNIYNGYGSTLIGIGFPGPVDVLGAWFGQHGASGWASLGVRVHGFRGGVEVETTGWFRDVCGEATWFPISLYNVDRIVIESDPILQEIGIFGMDDLTYRDSEPGDLLAIVKDEDTGLALPGATVSVLGIEGETDWQGYALFSGILSGEVLAEASLDGYYSSEAWANVVPNSGTIAVIRLKPELTGSDPGIIEVRGRWFEPGRTTYFLHGISLEEPITTRVDWKNHTPGLLSWLTPWGVIDQPWIDPAVSRTFDMGMDFPPDGVLRVEGSSNDDPTVFTDRYLAGLKVVSEPTGFPELLVGHVPFADTLTYQGSFEVDVVKLGIDPAAIPEAIPGFGGRVLGFLAKSKLAAKMTGDGKAEAELELPEALGKWEVAGIEIDTKVSGKALWEYRRDEWLPGGEAVVGVEGKFQTQPSYTVFVVGPVPVPAYWRGSLGIAAEGALTLQGWAGPAEPSFLAALKLEPKVEFILGVGVADAVSAEGVLGGSLAWEFEAVPAWETKAVKLGLAGSLRITVLVFKYEQPLLNYEWSLYESPSRFEQQGDPAAQPVEPELMDRDYLGRGYAVFVGDGAAEQIRSLSGGTVEAPIQTNVFPESNPFLANLGTDLSLAWLYDDPSRAAVNRTEVVYSVWDGANWSAPAAIDDDGTADFHPKIAALPDGDAWATWMDVKQVLSADATVEDMLANLEIAVARYDSDSDVWSSPVVLTDNVHLDQSPRIATAANATAMLTWVSNTGDELQGTAAYPNDIYFSRHDGTSWSAPAAAVSGVPSVIKSAMSFDGTNSVIVYSADTDGDDATPDDRELYGLTFDGTTWSAATLLTDNEIEDANPQVMYDTSLPTPTPLVFWYRDGEIVMSTDLDLDVYDTVVSLGASSSGAADFHATRGADGRIALIWQDISTEGVDLWYVYYDPTSATWSKPQQLTADSAMESAPSASFDAADRLVVACDKRDIHHETRTLSVGGEDFVVDNVPVTGQTDLYELRHEIGTDLAIAAEDLSVLPENPKPGIFATLTVIVHNIADLPATDIDVAFYDGNPATGGTLIATGTCAGTLVGGDVCEASVGWTVPASTSGHTVYVVVDPDQVTGDEDRTNNTAILGVMMPNLTVSSLSGVPVAQDWLVTVHVENNGALPVENAEVVLRDGDASGTVLDTATIAELAPRSRQALLLTWSSAPPGRLTAFATADATDTIAEFDESDNTATVLLERFSGFGPDPDLDGDTDVDLDDYSVFALCLAGPNVVVAPAPVTEEQFRNADLDEDGDVDLADFAAFANVFSGASLWGACCGMNGDVCSEVTAATCTEGGGTFQGVGTECGPDTCPYPGACCDPEDGTCSEVTESVCVAGGGSFQGIGVACASDVCPFGRYSNEIEFITGFFAQHSYGALADDLTLSGTGARRLVYYDLAVYGAGGGEFDVTATLYTDCPGNGGTAISGTTATWYDVQDDGRPYILQATIVNYVTIPDSVWMVVDFSTPEAGWIIAEEAELGSTADVFGINVPPWGCNYYLSETVYAGFWANLDCVAETTARPATAQAVEPAVGTMVKMVEPFEEGLAGLEDGDNPKAP